MDIGAFIEKFGLGITGLVAGGLFVWKGVWPFLTGQVWLFIVGAWENLQKERTADREAYMASLTARDEEIKARDAQLNQLNDTWQKAISERDQVLIATMSDLSSSLKELRDAIRTNKQGVGNDATTTD
jgi:hypothetical protein